MFQVYLDKIMKSRDMETVCKLHEGDFLFPTTVFAILTCIPTMVFAILTCIPWKQRAPIKHFSFQAKGIFNCVDPEFSSQNA